MTDLVAVPQEVLVPDYGTPYEEARLALIDRALPGGAGRGLDVGCHEGVTTELLAGKGWSVVGIDLDAAAIECGRVRRPTLDLRTQSLQELISGGERFDIVSCLEVVEHVPLGLQAEFVRQLGEVSRPGARLVLSTPGRWSLMSLYERLRLRRWRDYDWWDPTHVGVLSVRQLRRLLESSGWRVDSLVGFYLLPLRVSRPRPVRLAPINRLGFDLVVTATWRES
ncbi:MAG: ubiG [Frankiales bacterium]|nr:ubiG [Frankiales bacterium]